MDYFREGAVDAVPHEYWAICRLPSNRPDPVAVMLLTRLTFLSHRHGCEKIYCTHQSLCAHYGFTASQIRRGLERLRAANFIDSNFDAAGWHVVIHHGRIKNAARHNICGRIQENTTGKSVKIASLFEMEMTPTLSSMPGGGMSSVPGGGRLHSLYGFKDLREKTQERLTLPPVSWHRPDLARDFLFAHIRPHVKNLAAWKEFLLKAQRYDRESGYAVTHHTQQLHVYRTDPIVLGAALLLVRDEFDHPEIAYVAAALHHRRTELVRRVVSVCPWYEDWQKDWLRHAKAYQVI